MARTSTQSAEQTTVEMPETAWQQKSTHERTEMLAPLIGKQVRYIDSGAYTSGLRVFGPHYPKPWQEVRLTAFATTGGENRDPAAVFATGYSTLFNKYATRTVRFDSIYDVEAVPEEPPVEGPDYDGADVYEANEVACPHCGEKLTIVQRATVEKATPANDESAD